MSNLISHGSLDSVDVLVESGVREGQAKVQIKVMNQNINHFAEHYLASKSDIQNLRHEIECVEVKLNAEMRLVSREIGVLGLGMKREMQTVPNDIRYEIKILEQVIKGRFISLYWMLGICILEVGLLIARDLFR